MMKATLWSNTVSALLFLAFVPSVAYCAAEEPIAPLSANSVIVSRDLSDPSANHLVDGAWVTAGGSFQGIPDRAPGARNLPNAESLRITVKYRPSAFQYWSMDLNANIPGDLRRLTAWTRKVTDNAWGPEVVLVDATNREFKLGVPCDSKEWTKVEIKLPSLSEMKMPVRLASFSFHNWGDRGNPNEQIRTIDICDLRAETDVGSVPEGQRPYGLSLSFPVIANCFYYNEDKPRFCVSATSWLGHPVDLSFEASVKSADGETFRVPVPNVTCLDTAASFVDLPTPKPGAYMLTVSAKGFPTNASFRTRYIVALHPPKLTPEQLKASTYGIGVHGGGYVGYEKFARLGFSWVRDYAFNFHWMNRARGEGAYAGWPWYPKIFAAAEANGMLTLPCLMGAIVWNPNEKSSPMFPTDEWRRQIALIVSTFPDQPCWELDNERDATVDSYSDGYGKYHKSFGDIMHACVPDKWAVEEGSAGIKVEATLKHVKSGDYRNIDVCNGHRYCGIDAPEYSKSNANSGQGEARKTFLRDLWRHWKAAATADGKDRQLWITEWGWDTRAGQIVTEWEQAAYMQREWVLAMGNSIDKMFWYWYYDSDTDNPQNFFDGCGIFDRFHEPKPVASAFAALRTFLPADMKYVGYANIDENHMAHILKVGDKYVAMAFKINLKGADLAIKDPKAEHVYDMFGAERKPGKHTLDIAPTWYVGLDPACGWLKQAPMDLKNDFFVRNVSGEPIRIVTTANDICKYSVEPPKGWTVVATTNGFDVTGPEGLPRGDARIVVTGVNGGIQQVMPVEVDIVPQAYATSFAADFDGKFTVDVVNQSIERQTYKVATRLPKGWTVTPTENSCTLDPDEKATLAFTVRSSTVIPPTEKVATPKLDVVNSKGMTIDSVPVIPRDWTVRRIKPGAIKFDGDLSDWGIKYQMPAWMLGPRGEKEKSRFFMAYADDGLCLAFDVDDSKCMTSDPRSFWRAADVLEINYTTRDPSFKDGQKWGVFDHQFWFCPLVSENRIFVGFWGNCDEQKGEDDIKDAKSGLRKTDRGYVMEVFIPARLLNGYTPKPGHVGSLGFNLTVQGLRDPREVYWPAAKRDAVKRPWKWGRITFGD